MFWISGLLLMVHGVHPKTMTSYSFRADPPPRARPFQNGRFLFIRGTVVFMFAMLALRLVYVQAVLRSDLQQKADRQIPRSANVRSMRNNILDRHGAVLAETVQVTSCYVDPSEMKDKKKVAKFLADVLDVNFNTVLKKINSTKGSFVWIKRNVPAHAVEQIKSQKISGVGFKKEWRRNYPLTPIASHLIGLVGIDGHGLSGIEMMYEASLSGQIPDKLKKNPPVLGDIQLSIDATIQKVVEKELEWGAEKTGAKKGMAIVQDPQTGDILAIASWPPISLDPDDPPDPLELRIPPLVDAFEPGSTFKIVIAAASIEEKTVRPHELFSGENGKWKVKDITIHDHEARPVMTFDDIFVYSSNIGTGKLAEKLGAEKLFQYIRLFGFGIFPGSGLPAEAKGVLRPLNKWSGVSKYVISFGQELSVTGLQVVGAYSAIANGGTLMEPRIVKAIKNTQGKSEWNSFPTPVRRVVSLETAHRVTDILSKAVEEGTGQNAAVQWRKDFKVAGKTGTAQKFDSANRRYHKDQTLISFCGYFPANAPTFSMIIIYDEPEGRRWGGMDAAPVFRRIAEQIAAAPNT